MPIYLFENQQTGEIHEVVYHMNDIKDYRGPDGKAARGDWKRVWTKPQASIDTQVDPYSAADFVKATNKPGTFGDMWDRSAELSAKRADKEGGIDPVKQKFYDGYSSKRNGKKHPQEQREINQRALKKQGIRLDYGDN